MRFNIVVFGSHHKTYASSCQEVTQENVARAVAWVQTNVSAGQHVGVGLRQLKIVLFIL
jgi:hypothetical protein